MKRDSGGDVIERFAEMLRAEGRYDALDWLVGMASAHRWAAGVAPNPTPVQDHPGQAPTHAPG